MTGFKLLQTHYIQVTLKELKLKRLHMHRLPLVDGAIKVLLSEHVMRSPTLLPCEITLYQCIVGKLLYTASILILTLCFLTCSVDIHML
jgi:hypothetical protein